jgi:NADH-quinone oxidoreductase subunit E
MQANDATSTMDRFIKKIITEQSLDRTKIITLLQLVQKKFGYISSRTIRAISKNMNIPEIEILGVASFYAQFHFNKPGKYNIKICQGTACHVRGGERLIHATTQKLQIKPGETTKDSLFTLERIACLGCCALAPVIIVDEKLHGQMTLQKYHQILEGYMKEGGKEDSYTI